MKIDLHKIIHSKCPGCKKYGLPAMRTVLAQGKWTHTCTECGRRYRSNVGINTIFLFGVLGLLFWAKIKWIDPLWGTIPNVLYYILLGTTFLICILSLLLYDRFAPLHEVFED